MSEAKDIEKAQEEKPKKKSLIKRLFKIILYIVLAIIGLNVLLYALLSIPYVQQKAADFAVGKLKSTLNTEVSIDEVRLKLFNHATLKGIYIEDQAKDTLLYANYLDVALSPWEFITSSKLTITEINLENFIINVNQRDSISDFNFQFVIDAFAGNDTLPADTTSTPLAISISDVNIKNGRLNYDVLSDTITPGLFNTSHISLYDFNGNVDLNSIDPDKFDISLNNLSAKEKSGLEIKNLKGHLFSDKSQLWVDGLALTMPNSHLITTKARYNLSSGEFEVGTEDTEISTEDLVAFLPNLKFLKNKINLTTDIKGALPAIDIEHINLTYGEDLILEGNANIASYERYGSSDISLSINRFKATPSAITSFARLGDSAFVAPDMLKDLGDVFLKGKIGGQLSKFKLDAEAWCRLGALNLLATGSIDTTFTNFNVVSNLRTQNFNLGKLVGDSTGIGRLTAHVNLRAQQSERQPLSATAQGNLDALQYQKETLKNIPFEGFYNSQKMGLSAKADWSIGRIFVDADMTQAKVPDVNVYLRVDTLHVDRFYKNENWINPRLSLVLKGNIRDLDIDNMTGKVDIDSLDFHAANFNLKPSKFTLEMGRNTDTAKYINLTSQFLSANITGQYTFATISDEFTNLMHNYLPDIFQQTKRIKEEGNNFTFNISAQNTEEINKIYPLPVSIMQPATISGRINTIDKLININGNIPYIRYGDYDIKGTTLSITNVDSAFNIQASSKVLMDKGDYGLSLKVDGADNNIHALADVLSNATNININGKIEALASFSRDENEELISALKVSPSDLKVGKLALNLLPAEIQNKGNRTEVHNFGIGVNKKRYFGADGVISELETDSLRAYFDHAEIGELLEAFDIKNIQGCIHGDILLTNLLEQPEVYTDGFEIADIVIFSDTLGTMNLESEWSDDYGGARLNATLARAGNTYAELDGTVYTSQDSLDLQLQLQQMPLEWTQPFMTGMLNKIAGTLSTNLMIEGSMKAPKLRGFVGFNNTQLGIDYTNVTYTISDTIRVSPDRIGLDNLTLRDSQGNTANVSATVTHKNFEDMRYTLNMQMNKLMVLNTEHRTDSLFYGRVFASGTVMIDGNDAGINMNMQVKNDKNSTLNILLPQRSEASDYQSVVYINVPEDKLKEQNDNAKPVEQPLPINLNIKLDVTPDIALGVVIDPATGDALHAKGSGTINFSYNLQTETMAAYGDYTINSGNVRLNLQGIKKLDFNIQSGSKLYFTGDPLKTRFDITAYRRVRADLRSLDTSFGTEGGATRVDVDAILDISGNMDKMDIGYNISLPGATEDIQRRVNSLISTDEQRIRQFASLIATNRFYSSGGSSGANFTDGLWTGLASSTLSAGLTALVGNILGGGWEVGTNIESNDGTFSDMDMSVNVSKKFLDDRLQVKTNVGYRTDQSTTSDESFIGDFDIEYQLNQMWTLKAYSHTNEKFYKQAPTTQGIGVVYSKEAATLKRLFQSFKPRRWRQSTETQIPSDSTSLPSDSTRVIRQTCN